MFKKMLVTGALALFAITSSVYGAGAAGAGAAGVNSTGTTVPQVAVAPAAVSPAEAEGLQFMREEEKLAHDVYVTLYQKWGVRVFDNISRASSSTPRP